MIKVNIPKRMSITMNQGNMVKKDAITNIESIGEEFWKSKESSKIKVNLKSNIIDKNIVSIKNQKLTHMENLNKNSTINFDTENLGKYSSEVSSIKNLDPSTESIEEKPNDKFVSLFSVKARSLKQDDKKLENDLSKFEKITKNNTKREAKFISKAEGYISKDFSLYNKEIENKILEEKIKKDIKNMSEKELLKNKMSEIKFKNPSNELFEHKENESIKKYDFVEKNISKNEDINKYDFVEKNYSKNKDIKKDNLTNEDIKKHVIETNYSKNDLIKKDNLKNEDIKKHVIEKDFSKNINNFIFEMPNKKSKITGLPPVKKSNLICSPSEVISKNHRSSSFEKKIQSSAIILDRGIIKGKEPEIKQEKKIIEKLISVENTIKKDEIIPFRLSNYNKITYNIEDFYNEYLIESNENSILEKDIKKISNFKEYYKIFNSLREKENKAYNSVPIYSSINYIISSRITNLLEVSYFCRCLRVCSCIGKLLEGDLVEIYNKNNKTNISLGIVIDVKFGKSSKDELSLEKKDSEGIIKIRVNPESKIFACKYLSITKIHSIVTSLKEYQALYQLKGRNDLIKALITDVDGNCNYMPDNSAMYPKLINILIKNLNLNLSQATAVAKCWHSEEKLTLIQGPPGTGKTSTIIALIAVLLGNSKRILVCAPSNTAVEHLYKKISKEMKDIWGKPFDMSNKVILNGNDRMDSVTADTRIVCSTLTSSNYNSIKYDYLIVDEACQATELNILIPMTLHIFSKMILVGDPQQLPPTVLSNSTLLEKSLFERISCRYSPHMLTEQYRMPHEICKISSELFYNNQLITNSGVFSYGKCTWFFDVQEGKEEAGNNKSFFNNKEIEKVISVIEHTKTKNTVLVLSPYKEQVALLQNELYKCKLVSPNISVNTIDGAQGSEADTVIVTTVRTKKLGFANDFRRINVAITRAKKELIIVGNAYTLSKSDYWKRIIEIVQEK